MLINKVKTDFSEILCDVFNGATIMLGGFGEAGSPIELIHALIDHGAKDLTIIANNAGNGRVGLGALIGQRQVKKVLANYAFLKLLDANDLSDCLDLVLNFLFFLIGNNQFLLAKA